MIIFTVVIDENDNVQETLKLETIDDLTKVIEVLGKYRDGYINILLNKQKEEKQSNVDNT